MKVRRPRSTQRTSRQSQGRAAIRYTQILPQRRARVFFVRDLPRRSVYGRPRRLTAAQIARVLKWHDTRLTLKALAAELGVSTSTLTALIKTRGSHYKQAPPEARAATLRAHRARRAQLE